MEDDQLAPAEGRVLGCLLEKERTTPGDYPLTLAGLLRACNQSTSRDPVVELAEHEVADALASLKSRGLVRVVHSVANRSARYRHTAAERWMLDERESAVVAVLLLRGPQTAGELRTRTERLCTFETVDEVGSVLARLLVPERGFVVEVERRPGQKERRWAQTLAAAFAGEPAAPHLVAGHGPRSDDAAPVGGSSPDSSGLEARVARLEDDLARLQRVVEELVGPIDADDRSGDRSPHGGPDGTADAP